MIRLQDIQTALLPVVGWEQDYNPQNQIDESLCISESGLTFQGAHPLVTLENIRSIMPDDYLFRYPQWQAGAYQKGAKVQYNSAVWIATNAVVLSDAAPGESGSPWSPYNMVSDYVRQLTVNGINTAIQNFLQEKQLSKETQTLLERRTFFDGAARLQATIDPRGKIVGFEIVPVRAMGVTAKIERIGLQMIGGTGKITMYLFHSSLVDPVRVVELNFTNTSGGFQWFVPEGGPIYMPYIPTGDGNDAGGAWFLCYNQNDLPTGMRALNVSKDWSVEPCQTCLGGSINWWRQLTKYLLVSPFAISAPADFKDYPEMFDIGEVTYTNTHNYGINLEISVGCDLSDFIISQRMMFANVIQRQVAATVLRTIAMNPDVRVNRNQVNATRDELLYELDGNPQGKASGLVYELKQAYRALSLDTRGLDRVCLSCNNHGVKYRTV